MRVWSYGIGFALAVGCGLGMGAGCSAGNGGKTSTLGAGGTGAGTTGQGGQVTITSSTGGTGTGIGDADVPDGLGSCTTFSAAAQQDPAAMLILLQASSSMAIGNKWPAAQQAVAQAIDEDVFDTMKLGMMTWPTSSPITGPACIFNLPVYCGAPGLPQQPITLAGTAKSSDPMGVRHDIYQYLTSHSPISPSVDPGNSTPLYDAMNNAYTALKPVTGVKKRILAVITDGGGSCTSVSSPQRPYYNDKNQPPCPDWEQPDTVNAMIKKWQTDPTTPIDTFIVGVPGSASHGETVQGYDTAPYSMLLALSTYAVSGSPTTVDPTCDKSLMFTKTGADPAHPCHFDLSGGGFNAAALAGAIAALRGKALGCVYDLPPPPMGQTIDPNKVNVVVTINGTQYTIPKRSNPSDMCDTNPCWDYDSMGKVVLIGIACSTVSSSGSAKVDIYVGCQTILK